MFLGYLFVNVICIFLNIFVAYAEYLYCIMLHINLQSVVVMLLWESA